MGLLGKFIGGFIGGIPGAIIGDSIDNSIKNSKDKTAENSPVNKSEKENAQSIKAYYPKTDNERKSGFFSKRIKNLPLQYVSKSGYKLEGAIALEKNPGMLTEIFSSSSDIPSHNSKILTTKIEKPNEIEFSIFQGNFSNAKDIKKVGTYRIIGVPKARQKINQIMTTFDIDENGGFSIRAVNIVSNEQLQVILV